MKNIIKLFILLALASCSNDDTILNSNFKLPSVMRNVKTFENGDSIIYYNTHINKGYFHAFYHNGEKGRGFFKVVEDSTHLDSTCIFFRSNGYRKVRLTYIDGKINGYQYNYTILGNISNCIFFENGKARTISKLYNLNYKDKEIGYGLKAYSILQNDAHLLTGELFFDSNMNIVDSLTNYDAYSTYYKVDGQRNKDSILIYPIGGKTKINIKIYKLEKDSKVELKIGEIDNLEKPLSFDTYNIGSTGVFCYSRKHKKTGWFFVRGEFKETIKDGQIRKIPIYFNYYVY